MVGVLHLVVNLRLVDLPQLRPSPARRYEAFRHWLTQRGLSFGKGRRFAASRYLDGGYVGVYEAELDGMGGVLRGAPSKIPD
jgi:hypothetical protein